MNINEMIFAIKIIDLDIKLFIKKAIIIQVFQIKNNNIHITITFIN